MLLWRQMQRLEAYKLKIIGEHVDKNTFLLFHPPLLVSQTSSMSGWSIWSAWPCVKGWSWRIRILSPNFNMFTEPSMCVCMFTLGACVHVRDFVCLHAYVCARVLRGDWGGFRGNRWLVVCTRLVLSACQRSGKNSYGTLYLMQPCLRGLNNRPLFVLYIALWAIKKLWQKWHLQQIWFSFTNRLYLTSNAWFCSLVLCCGTFGRQHIFNWHRGTCLYAIF